MTTPDATPRSWGAGITHLAGSFRHFGLRRVPRNESSPVGPPPLTADPQARRLPDATPAHTGGRPPSWPRFPDAVIRLALAATPAAPQPKTAPEAPSAEPGALGTPGTSGAGAKHTPHVSPGPAKQAQPKPSAKTPPRPDRSPAPVATVQHAPRISDRKTRRRAPLAVNTAVLLVLAAGVLHLVVSLRAAVAPDRPVPPAALQLQELGVPVDMVLSVARYADAAIAVVAFGICLLLASLVRDGRKWARAGVCVLVAAGLFFGFRDGSFAHVAAALVTALGAGLLFLPASSRFLATRGGRTA